MGSGTRLESGVEVRKGVVAAGGTDDDIDLVLAEQPEFFQAFGRQVIERARIIRGDNDCFRFTDCEIVIEIPALKRPTLASIQKNWGGVKEIECDDSIEEAVTLRLATILKFTEPNVKGPIYEHRLKKLRCQGKLFGFQHRQWLRGDQDQLPEPARSALKALLGNICIDFAAIIVVTGDGIRHLPYMRQNGECWDGGWRWVSLGFLSNSRLAVSGK